MINFARVQMNESPSLVLEMRNVMKRDGGTTVLDDVTFGVHSGEIVTLFGPSGAGKTLLLRTAAGLERIDSGEVYVSDRPVDSPASTTFATALMRNVGLVLRSYAVWPHMTVAANVAYPLTVRKRKGPEVRERVSGLLEHVGLGGLEQRSASRLDLRQQLLVAIARSLALEPDVILLDDPLANLDFWTRDAMRADLRLLQRKLGIGMLMATTNEVEALSLSDRMVVLEGGRIQQIGAPAELYRHPPTEQVRDLLGRNITFSGHVQEVNSGGAIMRLFASDGATLQASNVHGDDIEEGRQCLLTVRPEAIEVHPLDALADGQNVVRGIIAALLFRGDRYEATVELPWSTDLRLNLPLAGQWREGQPIAMRLNPDDLHAWPQPLPASAVQEVPTIDEALALGEASAGDAGPTEPPVEDAEPTEAPEEDPPLAKTG